MPFSYRYFKKEIRKHFINGVPLHYKILDVGPGMGTYHDLLGEFYSNMDCVEIYEPYIDRFQLKQKYKQVINDSITKINFDQYDYIILGDVLEHLTTEEAQSVINKIDTNKQKCLVAVPYSLEQEAFEGNEHEAHQQPDLTLDVMESRYPQLHLLYGNHKYGYYINYTDISQPPFSALVNRVKVLTIYTVINTVARFKRLVKQ